MEKTTEINYDTFAQIIQGHSAFQLLWAGIEFGIFETIHKNANTTLKDINAQLKFKENPIQILINGLLSLQLITRDEKTAVLKNSKIASQYLLKSSPDNLIGMAQWQRYIVYPAAIDFCEALKTNKNIGIRHFEGEGNTLYQRLSTNPKLEKVFQDAMQSLSESANKALVEVIDLKKHNHLLDFGGGNATNALRFYKHFEHLRVTILDIPSVCEKAKTNIAKNKLEKHIDVLPGDFFSTPFPKTVDAVLYSHIVTIWSPEKNIELFKRIYQQLPLGGKIFVFSTMANDNGIGPVLTAVGSVYFQTIATGEGMLYSKREVKEFLEKAGFSVKLTEGLPVDHSLLTGTKV